MARGLTEAERQALAGFFDQDLLRGDYVRMPHDRIAYDLQQRFRANSASRFAVRDMIQVWVSGGCR